MREIKFRALSLMNKFVYGYYQFNSGTGHKTILDENGRYHAIQPETVGQYTGLKDKNSGEIYEGDIPSFRGVSDEHIVVSWDEKTYSFCLKNELYGNVYVLEAFEESELEIIGNIYENPNLIVT